MGRPPARGLVHLLLAVLLPGSLAFHAGIRPGGVSRHVLPLDTSSSCLPGSKQLQHQHRQHRRRRSGSSVPLLVPLRGASQDGDEHGEQPGGLLSRVTEVLYRPVNITLPTWDQVKLFTGGGVLGLVAGLVLSVAVFLAPYGPEGSGLSQSLDLFENVLVDLEQSYVDEVDVQKLVQTALGSMLRTLDPYTEFENKEDTVQLQESVSGRYGGVGLVISGETKAAQRQRVTGAGAGADGKRVAAPPKRTIQVVSAFEGYAFDAGLRPGDTLVAIDGTPVEGLAVDAVRDLLRGAPDTEVAVSFMREGVGTDARGAPTPQEIVLKRRLVKLSDVKLATLVGDPVDGIAYIQLGGFSPSAGKDVVAALTRLELSTPKGIKGLVLDLRGNPGGLLDSAVEVSAALVPQGSDIVSAKGRAFGEAKYRSTSPPLRRQEVPLAVLTNSATASAAEIVSGAVQDLDAGVVVGSGKGRTFGKGLVQNVRPLPYDSSLKYTVAKYYTPSGRCIQSVNYSGSTKPAVLQLPGTPKTLPAPAVVPPSAEPPPALDNAQPVPEKSVDAAEDAAVDDAADDEDDDGPITRAGAGGDARFVARTVKDKDRKEFRTRNGRVVRDSGGIEADVVSPERRPSALEVALLVQNAYFDYAGQWAATHTFRGVDGAVGDAALRDFRRFVLERQRAGEYDLLALYAQQFRSLENVLGESGLKDLASEKIEPIKQSVVEEMMREFDTQKEPIRQALEGAILSRYLPESMVMKRQLNYDEHFKLALSIVKDRARYEALLTPPQPPAAPAESTEVA